MSLAAMLWALKSAPVENSQEQIILVVMADVAREDGTRCFLAQTTIADRARCSVRTVQRYLGDLEDRGVISRGDQTMVEHFPANHRPVVWDLNLTAIRGDNLSPLNRGDKLSGATPVTSRGDNGGALGATPVSYNPRTNPRTERGGSREVTTSLADDAIQTCSLCDSDGYAGTVVCDHDPGRAERISRGMDLVRGVLAERVRPPEEDESKRPNPRT